MTKLGGPEGLPYEPAPPTNGRRHYRYTVREFKIPDGDYHECTGQVVSVLKSYYSTTRKTWHVTVLVRMDSLLPHLSPGEEVWGDK